MFLEPIPLPGFTHMSNANAVAQTAAQGLRYHLTLTTWGVYRNSRAVRRAYFQARSRWHGRRTTIRISHVAGTGTAVVARTHGLSRDAAVRRLRRGGSHNTGPLTISMGF